MLLIIAIIVPLIAVSIAAYLSLRVKSHVGVWKLTPTPRWDQGKSGHILEYITIKSGGTCSMHYDSKTPPSLSGTYTIEPDSVGLRLSLYKYDKNRILTYEYHPMFDYSKDNDTITFTSWSPGQFNYTRHSP